MANLSSVNKKFYTLNQNDYYWEDQYNMNWKQLAGKYASNDDLQIILD